MRRGALMKHILKLLILGVAISSTQSSAAKRPVYRAQYIYTENGVYYYEPALTPRERREGVVASDASGFRYYGRNDSGEYILVRIIGDNYTDWHAYCKNPCRVIRFSYGMRLVNNSRLLLGNVFADAIHGKLRNTNPALGRVVGRVSIPSVSPVGGSGLPDGITRTGTGVRIRGPLNAPVYATADGSVSRVETVAGYGGLVQIEHGAEIATVFGNLVKIIVPKSSLVKKGQQIASAGIAQNSNESELIYEVRIAGSPVDPLPYMQADSQPVTQPSPGRDRLNLNAALARLGRNPRDLDALIDAGQATLNVDDVDAAIGLFRRAEEVTPGNPRTKAGLARALVRSGDPFDAIPLFDEAERAGAMDPTITLDRGLAYDLVADNATAQRYYRQVLVGGQTEEATRRLAISLAISGDKRGSGTMISPLLLRQDKASWRARAFALAILGQTEEAITVVNGTLPAGLAAGIAPYLRYMPRLTPAQQAAAANFGQFPRASEIGRDDPRIVRYAPYAIRGVEGVASTSVPLSEKGISVGSNAATLRAAGEARNISQSNNDSEFRRLFSIWRGFEMPSP
jgi:Flp pilus assembly protein TadD